MKMTATDIARALIDTCSEIQQSEFPDAVEAAVDLLRKNGLGKAVRTFPRLVRRTLEKKYGVLYVELTVPSGDETKNDILLALSEALGKSIELTVNTDPSLIGGALLRVGDERIDASVRGEVERLRTHITA